MAAANTDLLTKVGLTGTATTLAAPGYTIGNTSINVGNTANWPTDTGIIFAVDQVTTQIVNGVSTQVRVAGTYCEFEGTVASSSQINNLVLKLGTAQNYPAGSNTRVYIPVASTRENNIVTWGTAQHNQDGTHGAITATSLAATGAVTGASFNTTAANGINQAALPLGVVVQVQSTNYSALATGTTTIPRDDTIPQITEGDQFMAQAITPKSSTNRLRIEATLALSNSVINDMQVAIFQDSTANALAANTTYQGANGAGLNVKLTHDMVAGTTSATTLKVRAGGSLAGTTTFNGVGGGRLFGGITASNITITEYKA